MGVFVTIENHGLFSAFPPILNIGSMLLQSETNCRISLTGFFLKIRISQVSINVRREKISQSHFLGKKTHKGFNNEFLINLGDIFYFYTSSFCDLIIRFLKNV